MSENTKITLAAIVICAMMFGSFITNRVFDDIEHNRCLMNGGAPIGDGRCDIATEEKDREIRKLENNLAETEIKLEVCEKHRR